MNNLPLSSSQHPERIDPHQESRGIVAHHLVKYEFADNKLPGGVILDLGCGFGYGTAALSTPDRIIVGTDIDSAAVSAAHFRYSAKAVFYAVSDAESLPFRNDSADAIVCFEAIEHFKDPSTHLAEVVRVLRPHGLYIASTPRPGTGSSPEENPFHHHEFTATDFFDLLSRFFDHVTMKGQQRKRPPAQRAAVRLDRLELRKISGLAGLRRGLSRLLGSRATEDATTEDFDITDVTAETTELVAICSEPRGE